MKRMIPLLFFLTSCTIGSVNLTHNSLQVALVDELYEDYLDMDVNWNNFFNVDVGLYVTAGDLPWGLEVTDGGRILGIPRELGSYDFKITAYAFDYYGASDYLDSAWYTLFITEASTNPDCASPDSVDHSDIFLCLGELDLTDVRAGDYLTLDLNYYVDPRKADSYAITEISFSIYYDETLFSFDDVGLISGQLREAAYESEATISFDTSTLGVLGVTLFSDTDTFRRPGRLLDLSLLSLSDLLEGQYDLILTDISLTTENDASALPAITEVDGLLNIYN